MTCVTNNQCGQPFRTRALRYACVRARGYSVSFFRRTLRRRSGKKKSEKQKHFVVKPHNDYPTAAASTVQFPRRTDYDIVIIITAFLLYNYGRTPIFRTSMGWTPVRDHAVARSVRCTLHQTPAIRGTLRTSTLKSFRRFKYYLFVSRGERRHGHNLNKKLIEISKSSGKKTRYLSEPCYESRVVM